MKRMMWLRKALFLAGCILLQLSFWKLEACAAGTLYGSPYVTFSPDGKAWTTSQKLPEGVTDGLPSFWYSRGYTISTGIASGLRSLREGEHYYAARRCGEVPIGKWEVVHTYAQCVHRQKQYPENYYGGISYQKTICGKPYFSGWIPYCADCGEQITGFLHYMSKEAVSSIRSMDVNLGYYYLCPSCNHLEQGIDAVCHICRQISNNRYQVRYEANREQFPAVTGYTDASFHMYDNAAVFEGREVTPNTHLTMNGFCLEGFCFLGWNTKPDGSGTWFADGAEIKNLSTENYDEKEKTGIVTLYAQWKRIETNLFIDPQGGSYEGRTEGTLLRRQYDTVYRLKTDTVIAPTGYSVKFDVNGGKAISPQMSCYTFEGWKLQEPAGGVLDGEVYRFRGKMNDTDTIKASYVQQPVILPTPEKQNASFGGWYRDRECTEPVGYGGDAFIPDRETTLYAKWVELVLYAKNNYRDNNGKGAVDLSWKQADEKNKVYQLFQSTDGIRFKRIYDAEGIAAPKLPDRVYGCEEQSETVMILYTGFYTLTAAGAQGGGCGEYRGGKGGTVTGKFFLKKGEILNVTVGGQNGFNGGGSESSFGNGGGYTIISSNLKGTLLIAGGGGGATTKGNGGNGGEETGLIEQEPSLSGNAGENGPSGGGGGYKGGKKGIVSVGTQIISTNTFYYEGEVKEYSVPEDGLYRLEVWGAQGGRGRSNHYTGAGNGGLGGYSSGYRLLQKGDRLYICVGGGGDGNYYKSGSGTSYNGGGGGDGDGGGATHIALNVKKEALKLYSDNRDAVLIVAGGGGGGSDEYLTGGSGGGLSGGWGDVEADIPGGGQTYEQTLLGPGGHGSFGQGGAALDGSGGGGGWYGGNGGYDWNGPKPGGGGSGYIGGVPEIKIDGIAYSPATENGNKTGNGQARITQYENLAQPSCGGSSYINTRYAITYDRIPGSREGDGTAVIVSGTVGFQESQTLNGIAAPDLAAPNAVEVDRILVTASGNSNVKITWQKPADNGTAYYHKAESFEAESELPLCVSNITKSVLISGIKGYYYRVDNRPDTSVSLSDVLLETPGLTVRLTGSSQYLHLAAVDVAGNLSATTHVRLDNAEVVWPLYTEPLGISSVIAGVDNKNVYPAPANRTWYVRADGSTPFLLSFDSRIDGKASEKYQIIYQILDSTVAGSSENQKCFTRLPLSVPVSVSDQLDAGQFLHQTEGVEILNHAIYAGAVRSDNACRNSYFQAFTLKPEFHGKTIKVIPSAGADFEKSVVYSDRNRDLENAIQIIADAEGPLLGGLEVLRDYERIDRGSRTVNLCITAYDAVSGVGDFYLKICNTDNFGERVYRADESGAIRVDITEEDALFTGDFTVLACAVDHVGNVTEESFRVTEFALETRVERILEPHTPILKRGESGILYIATYGYADRVEVEFPEELAEYNKTVTYSAPLYCQEEQLQFMIPLYTPENESYTITVRAYKGDKRLEDYPSFSTVKVEGSVLDELRTRLR